MRQMLSVLGLSLAFALGLARGSTAVPITIDDFEDGDFLVSAAAGSTSGEQSPINVIGGTRFVGALAGTTAVSTASLTTTPGDDGVTLSSTPNTASASFSFVYDGIPNLVSDGTGGALSLDLGEFGYITVDATVSPFVAVFLYLDFDYWTSSGFHQLITRAPIFDGINRYNYGGGLSDIRTIRIIVGRLRVGTGISEPATATINSISLTVVPEPATSLLVITALLGLAAWRMR